MAEFLLEVGCEEIPASWFAPPADLRGSFQNAMRVLLSEARLVPPAGPVPTVHSTPRRLVLVADVLPRQEDRITTLLGPPAKAARDASGSWTKAALGFAAKAGVPPGELREVHKDPSKPGELYLCHDRREEGQDALAVLPGVIAGALRRLPFPKRMSWDAWIEDGRGAFPFGRPIRWIVALLDGRVVPFAIDALRGGARGEPRVGSGGTTFGHRFLPRGSGGLGLPVRSLAELEETLARHFVVLRAAGREERIRAGLEALTGAEASVEDHGLLAEWRDLVEYPTVVCGRIPAEFRTLPAEVLETVLVHHQKYIPLLTDRVAARFAAVVNSDAAAAPEIVRGLERVVVARLKDAAFFFAEDMKKPLADRVADLAGVSFHQGLGTYKDKTDRLVRLVDAMGAEMGVLTKPEHEAARQAAGLAKADLTTLMVREFPELQGVMGGIYLRAQGNPWENVVRAVRWHYHPVSVEEGSEPADALSGSDSTVFAAVSLADKLDTLAGYFGLGLSPTGSSDPYGLRRAGQGAVRVVLDFWSADAVEVRPDLVRLLEVAVSSYAGHLKMERGALLGSLRLFLLDRMEYVFSARGFPPEEIAAVLHTPSVDALQDPYDAMIRLKALHGVRARAREDFEGLAVAFKRANNILKEQPAGPIDPSRFEAEAERELHAAVVRLKGTEGRYDDRLLSLAGLRAPVDRFFDDVLVMAEDPGLRANRLGLLSEARSLFYRIADISKLGG